LAGSCPSMRIRACRCTTAAALVLGDFGVADPDGPVRVAPIVRRIFRTVRLHSLPTRWFHTTWCWWS
jgi:hypothetical protein